MPVGAPPPPRAKSGPPPAKSGCTLKPYAPAYGTHIYNGVTSEEAKQELRDRRSRFIANEAKKHEESIAAAIIRGRIQAVQSANRAKANQHTINATATPKRAHTPPPSHNKMPRRNTDPPATPLPASSSAQMPAPLNAPPANADNNNTNKGTHKGHQAPQDASRTGKAPNKAGVKGKGKGSPDFTYAKGGKGTTKGNKDRYKGPHKTNDKRQSSKPPQGGKGFSRRSKDPRFARFAPKPQEPAPPATNQPGGPAQDIRLANPELLSKEFVVITRVGGKVFSNSPFASTEASASSAKERLRTPSPERAGILSPRVVHAPDPTPIASTAPIAPHAAQEIAARGGPPSECGLKFLLAPVKDEKEADEDSLPDFDQEDQNMNQEDDTPKHTHTPTPMDKPITPAELADIQTVLTDITRQATAGTLTRYDLVRHIMLLQRCAIAESTPHGSS